MRHTFVLVWVVLLVWCAEQTPSDTTPPRQDNHPQADGAAPAQKMLFDRDPQHPWNRLYLLLYSRTTQDGKVYDQESLEPFLVAGSTFLTEGPSHQQALRLFDQFLKERADERIKDPVKRAILQRDLWVVFSTTVGEARQVIRVDEQRGRITTTDQLEDPGDDGVPEMKRAQRRTLQKRLVQVMSRVALSPKEIETLPDNLSQAVKAGAFPRTFDAKHPDRAFLPPDLLAKGGSWVAVSNRTRALQDSLAAPEHVRFTKGRSVFVVFLRLPEGRAATAAFLKKTQNGDVAQFPEGTQTALLRRMLLIDRAGKLCETPLTESLQIRVYRKLDLGVPFEFTLRRRDLFAGRGGGLHAVGANETSYFDFQTRGGDVFEMPRLPPAEAIMQTCGRCHARLDGRGGIHTVNTIYARGGCGQTATGLWPTTLSQEARATMDWVRKSYTWGLLQGMWEARTGNSN